MDTVRAFEWGADDFVQLSAGSEVLAAQVLALLRRVGPTGARCPESVITRGHLIINPLTRDVFLQGRHVSLTATEFKLLYVLAKYTHLTVSREFIRHLIWREQGAASPIEHYVQRLRLRLGDDPQRPTLIRTVENVGYRLTMLATTP